MSRQVVQYDATSAPVLLASGQLTDNGDGTFSLAGGGGGGATVLSGAGAPSSGTGSNGDFYINTTSWLIYGPKASGTWPSGVSLIGSAGTNGTNGYSVLSGSGAPSSGTGVNGDWYINTATSYIYGPKAGGSWPSGISLVGPTGATGAAGANGTNGNTVLSGSGSPSSGTGVNGDWYIDQVTKTIYGPKTAGAWGTGTALVVAGSFLLYCGEMSMAIYNATSGGQWGFSLGVGSVIPY